jgi:hypothetical protein
VISTSESEEVVPTHYSYRDTNGPQVTWKLRNVQNGDWIEVEGMWDDGSDVTNLPLEYASKLGIDLGREEKLTLSTVGGDITGYLAEVEYEFANLTFNGPVVFRPGASAPLLGRRPIFQYFDIYFDNRNQAVQFIPITSGLIPSPSSIMQLKFMVAKVCCALCHQGLPREYLQQ